MGDSLRILHVLRAPVGGLFRHVADLAAAQAARGHAVGLVLDSTTGGAAAESMLQALAPVAALGIHRLPMSRHLGLSDFGALRAVAARARESNADVLHGHGAKGGAYARLAGTGTLRVYTPHGGSLHYGGASPLGLLYLNLERALSARTDLFLFESAYALAVFRAKIGAPRALARVVHNGVRPEELLPVAPDADAADVVFVGELRRLKGVDLLIEALSRLLGEERIERAILFGDGPEAAAYRAEVERRGLSAHVQFGGVQPARAAFRRGRVLAVPSRAESLPYIVLEAAAASVPLVATRVGGIAEIFGPDATALVPPEDPVALARAILEALEGGAVLRTKRLRERVGSAFTVDAMAEGALAAYRESLAAK
ncbi:MAG TPA: glycosyltransferase family 4 protein [Xanthobacteraceae bacterium]|nr:glycosyltransferase family 4 protein [Xanthobacteraceae bacterium]